MKKSSPDALHLGKASSKAFLDLLHYFDRINRRGVHLPLRGVNRARGGSLFEGGSSNPIFLINRIWILYTLGKLHPN